MKDFEIVQKTNANGQIITVPKAVIKGEKPGPSLALVAAVHGCEFCGIEVTVRLYRDLRPDEIAGTIRMAMVANLPAFRARTMYKCPIDGGNVGRSFPGSQKGTYSELLAHVIWTEVVGDAEYVLDLHGGDLIEILAPYIGYSTTGNQELDKKTELLALAFGAQNIQVRPLKGEGENVSAHNAAAHEGKVGLLVEAGSQGRRDEKDVLFHYKGVINVMRHIGMLPGSPEKPKQNVRILDDFIGVRAGVEGLFYPSAKANDLVEEGELLGQIRDFTGKVLEEVISPARSVVLGVITAAGTYAGSMLFGLGHLKEEVHA